MTALVDFELREAGDSALVLALPERVDPLLNAWCIAVAGALRDSLGSGVRDVVVGYCTVTVYFDPLASDPAWLENRIRALAARVLRPSGSGGAAVDVPVCYGGEYGPDLDEVATFAGCTAGEVAVLHSQTAYRVYLLGFVPGFAYMAAVDPRIARPRRSTPRTTVPPGSVAIAGEQTGVYPGATPGGWNIIGRTPVRPYDPSRPEPFLFRPGDLVRFHPIDRSEYLRLA
ncbi:MAG TPA: 5-oxoprolinase subunit PxpB [Vicinamibacterales bacterium]|nr:5-oxoprolinase subunit PxpB [Vicinamibacterales bacterium]